MTYDKTYEVAFVGELLVPFKMTLAQTRQNEDVLMHGGGVGLFVDGRRLSFCAGAFKSIAL